MDIPVIDFTDGLALTSTKLDTEFAKITGHGITRADFVPNFSWGTDIDLGGFGFTTVRHLNGQTAFANQFLNGNDSLAIQAAVNFVAATAQGKGIVYIPALSGVWTISSTVTIPSNVEIVGLGMPVLRQSLATTTFLINPSATGVQIRGIVFDGQARNGAVAIQGEDVTNVVIENCQFGSLTTDGARHTLPIDIVGNSKTTTTDIVVRNCLAAREDSFMNFNRGTRLRVENNHFYLATAGTGRAFVIKVVDFEDFGVKGNFLWNWNVGGSAQGANNVVHIAGSTTAGDCRDGVVAGNYCLGSAQHGFLLEKLRHVTIQDNDMWNAGSEGTGGTANTYDACHIDDCDHCVIEDNTFTSTSSTLGGPASIVVRSRYGIRIEANCDQLIVINNFLEAIGDSNAGADSIFFHGDPNTGGTATGAGISIAGSPVIYRRGNHIIREQVGRRAPAATALNTTTLAVSGVRNVVTDAARQAQYVCTLATLEDTSAAGFLLDTPLYANNVLNLRKSTAWNAGTPFIHWEIVA